MLTIHEIESMMMLVMVTLVNNISAPHFEDVFLMLGIKSIRFHPPKYNINSSCASIKAQCHVMILQKGHLQLDITLPI
jgi:hypothetical protein